MKEVGGITLYTTKDIAEQMGVSELTVRAWFREGKIRGRKIGRTWTTTQENLRAFLAGEPEAKPQEKGTP